jgi:hypothetical protein
MAGGWQVDGRFGEHPNVQKDAKTSSTPLLERQKMHNVHS